MLLAGCDCCQASTQTHPGCTQGFEDFPCTTLARQGLSPKEALRRCLKSQVHIKAKSNGEFCEVFLFWRKSAGVGVSASIWSGASGMGITQVPYRMQKPSSKINLSGSVPVPRKAGDPVWHWCTCWELLQPGFLGKAAHWDGSAPGTWEQGNPEAWGGICLLHLQQGAWLDVRSELHVGFVSWKCWEMYAEGWLWNQRCGTSCWAWLFHSKGSGRGVHSLSSFWLSISITYSCVLEFFWMINFLYLQFREQRNAAKSWFVFLRPSPQFKKLCISCRPEILLSYELSCLFLCQFHTCS